MSDFLVHIVTGPEHPTRAAMGFLVARTALDQGHDVKVFLAGDGVQLIRDAVLDNLTGLGTGSLREHYDALVKGGARFYVSGKSSAGRGVDPESLKDKPAEMAMPDELVRLATAADTVVTY